MSHKTAKTVTNKFLSTTKSDREGRRTVGSGRVATIIYNLKFYVLDCIPQSLRNQGLRFFYLRM